MATIKQIQFKRTTKAGVKPTAVQLAEGELAINLTDRMLFTKDQNGAIIDLGFAKGGNIDGNVTQTGNYTQTGRYDLNGDMTAINVAISGDTSTKSIYIQPNGAQPGRPLVISNYGGSVKRFEQILAGTASTTDFILRGFHGTTEADFKDIATFSINPVTGAVRSVLDGDVLLSYPVAKKLVINTGLNGTTVLGDNSIAIGDSDTGIKWLSDGKYAMVSNGAATLRFQDGYTESVRSLVFRYSNADYGNNNLIAPDGASLARFDTHIDSNQEGDGNSYFALNQGGKYNHYLRGAGMTYIDTLQGLRVGKGLYAINGMNTDSKPLTAYDISSMTGQPAGETISINRLRRFRAREGGTIMHEAMIQEATNDNYSYGLTYWTGAGIDTWISTLKNDGTLVLRNGVKTNGAGGVFQINSSVASSGYLQGNIADNTSAWLIGKSRGDDSLVSFASHLNKADANSYNSLNLRKDGSVTVTSQGRTNKLLLNKDHVLIDATQWPLTYPHGYGEQWAYDAPVTVDMGNVSGVSDYYPCIAQKTIATTYGYNTKIELGTLRNGGAQWGRGIIRVGTFGYEPDRNRQGVFTFTIEGDFISQRYVTAPHFLTGVGSSAYPNKPGITIGDNDTGIYWGGDGIVAHFANSIQVAVLDSTGFRTEGGRSLVSNGDLNQANDAHSTYVRDIYIRSDIRVKSELRKFESPSETLKKMNGYLYLQKKGFKEDGSINWEQSSGLIAQEVQAVLPELISVDKDNPEGLLRLNYNGIIALNTATINEHTDEISELKARIQKLEEIISALI